jgi:hypothetical protein
LLTFIFLKKKKKKERKEKKGLVLCYILAEWQFECSNEYGIGMDDNVRDPKGKGMKTLKSNLVFRKNTEWSLNSCLCNRNRNINKELGTYIENLACSKTLYMQHEPEGTLALYLKI